jgi:hypothetical protein
MLVFYLMNIIIHVSVRYYGIIDSLKIDSLKVTDLVQCHEESRLQAWISSCIFMRTVITALMLLLLAGTSRNRLT